MVLYLRRLLANTIYHTMDANSKYDACCTPTIRRSRPRILLKFGGKVSFTKLRNLSIEYQERTMKVSIPTEGSCLTEAYTRVSEDTDSEPTVSSN